MAPALPIGEIWVGPVAGAATVIGEIWVGPVAGAATVIGETGVGPVAGAETVIGEIWVGPVAGAETVIGEIGPAPGAGAGVVGPWGLSSAGAGSTLATGFSGAEGFSAASDFGASLFGVVLLATASGSAFSSAACRIAGLVGSPVAAFRSESGSGTSLPPQPTHDKQTPAIARRPNHAPIDLMAAILLSFGLIPAKTDHPDIDPEDDPGVKDAFPADRRHSTISVQQRIMTSPRRL